MTVGSLVYSCVGRRRKRIPRCFTTPALPALPGRLSGNRPWAVCGGRENLDESASLKSVWGKGASFFHCQLASGPVSSLFFPLLRIALASVERWGRSLLFPFSNLLFLWGAFPALTSPAGFRCITVHLPWLTDRLSRSSPPLNLANAWLYVCGCVDVTGQSLHTCQVCPAR